jgi:hypothetical protein
MQGVRHLGRDEMSLNFTFQIETSSVEEFVSHWSQRYRIRGEENYTKNIGKPLTILSRLELFEWKNGSKIAAHKLCSIERNYPLRYSGNLEERYLNNRKSGGAIWNIFYLHCLKPDDWPIFDQHTYRAMKFLLTGSIQEIGTNDKRKYEIYLQEYLPFLNNFGKHDARKTDRALFAFGQYLKIASRYA